MNKTDLIKIAASVLSLVMVIALAGSFVPAAAAETATHVIYSQDFESFDVSASPDDIFSDERGNKPAGMTEFIGNGQNSGGNISTGKVGGSKSLKLMRIDGGEGCIRIGGLSTRTLGTGSKLYFSFSFRYAVLGNYGFTAILSGIDASPNLDNYGQETRNIFAVKTDMNTGKDSIFVVNPDGSADRILVCDTLKAGTDYKLTAAFTLGSDEYEVLLNGERLGTYKYIGKMTGVTGIRIDCHDWAYECDISRSQPGDVHVNEVYFDDISLTAAPEGTPDPDLNKSYKFDDFEEYYAEDFEILEDTDEYAHPAEDTPPFMYNGGLPFIQVPKTPFINPMSYVKVVSGSDGIDGETLALKDFADMRFWSINYPVEDGDSVLASIDLNVKNLTGYFDMCVSNFSGNEGSTSSESQGGLVFRVTRSSTGKLELTGTKSQLIAELEPGRAYNIGVALTAGSDRYEFFIDGKHVQGSTCVYPEEFASVTALRFDMDGAGSEILLDNIILTTGTLEPVSDAPATDAPTEAPTEVPATEAPTEVPATEAPTEVPATAAPTEAPASTDAPAKTAEPADNVKRGGSATGWIIGGCVLAAGAIAAVCVILAKKKKKG